jgi:hypothetical protein
MTITWQQRKELSSRSGDMCEAMELVGSVYTRCWKQPIEIHHLLTRARGGGILDYVGETYHLIALCRNHHLGADGAEAYLGNLLITGYVVWDKQREVPIYTGPDIYLRENYGVKSVRH